jgi:hypothetical protein
VSIYFGADLAIDQRFIRWSEGHLTQRPGTAQALAELYTLPGETAATQDIVLTLRELGGYLSGMTLQADGDGRLADHVLWIVATNPTPNASQLAQHDRLRGTAAGYLPAATLRPLALNLAAAVSWGAWTPPRPRSTFPTRREASPGDGRSTPARSVAPSVPAPTPPSGSWTWSGPPAPAGPGMPSPASRPGAAPAPTTVAATGTSTAAGPATTGTTRAVGSRPGASTPTSATSSLAARSIACPSPRRPP